MSIAIAWLLRMGLGVAVRTKSTRRFRRDAVMRARGMRARAYSIIILYRVSTWLCLAWAREGA